MFLSVLGFLSGLAGPISSVVNKIQEKQIALANAQTDQERIRIAGEIRELEGRQAVLVAEAGNNVSATINSAMRAFIAFGPASYIFKYYFFDKVIGSLAGCAGKFGDAPGCWMFATDGLTVQMASVMTAVVAFYFLYDMAAGFRKKP